MALTSEIILIRLVHLSTERSGTDGPALGAVVVVDAPGDAGAPGDGDGRGSRD